MQVHKKRNLKLMLKNGKESEVIERFPTNGPKIIAFETRLKEIRERK